MLLKCDMPLRPLKSHARHPRLAEMMTPLDIRLIDRFRPSSAAQEANCDSRHKITFQMDAAEVRRHKLVHEEVSSGPMLRIARQK